VLILLTIAVLSVACNVPIYFMLRYSADPRNSIPAPSYAGLDIPDLTFDSRGFS
jgi:hypothetical protein